MTLTVDKGQEAPPTKLSSISQADQDIIDDMMSFMQTVVDTENQNRLDMVDDLMFLTGNHWPENFTRERMATQRPALTINKLPNFLHQVTNDQRLNRPQINVHPVDSRADKQTAKILKGAIKHIEYNSNADVARDRAVNSAAAIGVGYLGLRTDYISPDSFDQEIYFRSFRNTFSVYFDPMSVEPDGSDAKRVCISVDVPKKEFRKHYPNASVTLTNTSPIKGTGDKGIMWLGVETVRLTEFYRIEQTAGKLCLLSNGESVWKDDYTKEEIEAAGLTIVKERDSFKKKVMWYKCTCCEILERTEILCKWIPVFPVYGDEVDVDGKVYRSGIIRWAKDPSRMYDYWMTAATEEVALRPKAPYIGAVGAFESFENQWENANRVSYPYLEYNPINVDGILAPPPQRQPMADIPVGMIQMAMHANDNIKATTGLFDSSLGAAGTATSGVQERAQQSQGDVANYHYQDGLLRTNRHIGRCLLDMIRGYYDTERIIRIMGEDDEMNFATVNQPQQGRSQQGEVINRILNDVTVPYYDVTVTSGPSYSTMREEAVANMVELGSKWQKLMDVAGDIVVSEFDWPGADKIAERIKRTLPPQLTAGGDDPESAMMARVQAQLEQGQAQLQAQAAELAEREKKVSSLEESAVKAKTQADLANKDFAQAQKDLQAEKERLKDKETITLLRIQLAEEKARGMVDKAISDVKNMVAKNDLDNERTASGIKDAVKARKEKNEVEESAEHEAQEQEALARIQKAQDDLVDGIAQVLQELKADTGQGD